MEKHGVDAAWISSPENHLYLSGFANPDGRIFITAEKAYLFADFRYAENARRLCSGSFEVIEPKDHRRMRRGICRIRGGHAHLLGIRASEK